MTPPKSNNNPDPLKSILALYTVAIKNFPLLKYSAVFMAAACVLAVAGYYKLQNADVFYYGLIILFVSFIGFLLSHLIKGDDLFKKILLKILVSCIVATTGVIILGFGSYIICGQPTIYNRLFRDTVKNAVIVQPTSVTHNKDTTAKSHADAQITTKTHTDTEVAAKKPVKAGTDKPARTIVTILRQSNSSQKQVHASIQILNSDHTPAARARVSYQGNVLGATDDNGRLSINKTINIEGDDFTIDVEWQAKRGSKTIGINQQDAVLTL